MCKEILSCDRRAKEKTCQFIKNKIEKYRHFDLSDCLSNEKVQTHFGYNIPQSWITAK